MARDGSISDELAAAVPGRAGRAGRARARSKTEAPAAVENVLAELRAARRRALHGGGPVRRGSIRVHVDGRQAHPDDRERGARERPRAPTRSGIPRAGGSIQGSVVVLRNAGRARPGGGGRPAGLPNRARRLHRLQPRRPSSLRQPGSAMKPIVYLAAFRQRPAPRHRRARRAHRGADGRRPAGEVDRQLRRRVQGRRSPMRQALAESRNAVADVDRRAASASGRCSRTARELGIRTPLQPYLTTALGASEVHLLELANAYRAIASGIRRRAARRRARHRRDGSEVYRRPPRATRPMALPSGAPGGDPGGAARRRSACRGGTAHALDARPSRSR